MYLCMFYFCRYFPCCYHRFLKMLKSQEQYYYMCDDTMCVPFLYFCVCCSIFLILFCLAVCTSYVLITHVGVQVCMSLHAIIFFKYVCIVAFISLSIIYTTAIKTKQNKDEEQQS